MSSILFMKENISKTNYIENVERSNFPHTTISNVKKVKRQKVFWY